MIQFAMPWLLGAGVMGAAVITALHFFSVRRPPELLLPTARFLDEGRVRAVSRSAQPSDLLLLLMRVAALLLASAAFAGPQCVSRSHRVARIVIADATWRSDTLGLLRSLGPAATTSMFTRFVWSDSLDAMGAPTGLRVDLSAALPMAVRAATALSTEHLDVDSIRLFVAAVPGANVERESWRAWRSVWPGAVTVVGDVSMTNDETPIVRFDSVGADDVLRSAFATRLAMLARQPGSGPAAALHEVFVRRSGRVFTPPANVEDGWIAIAWPENGVPAGWQVTRDTVGAVAAKGVALVASWARSSTPSVEAMRGARAIAWWSDGAVAATERAMGTGCVRDVGIVVPPSSDILLDANANGLMSALLAPCAGSARSVIDVPESILTDSLDRTHGAAAPASHFRPSSAAGARSTPRWLAPALLVFALVLLLAEWLFRDRRDTEIVEDGLSATSATRAGARA